MCPELISVEQARAIVLSACRPVAPERVEVAQALDRVLAQDVDATLDIPPFPSSAMDGYAVLAADGASDLRIVGESRAGTPCTRRLAAGEAIRISTGAAVPDGADAVIRQEDTETLSGDLVRTLSAVTPGENVRPAAEVMRVGARVLERGATLGPTEIAAVVTAGLRDVLVGPRPRTGVLGTGDELLEPGQPLGPGQIHDSNGAMLRALAVRAGASVAAPVRLPDDREQTIRGLQAVLSSSDVVVITGGVSVGPHDHVKPALAELGVQERFWGVALQPGKPTWFGTRDQTLVFGLPGNPVSAAVTFTLFVAPALAVLQGRDAAGRGRSSRQATLGREVRQNRGREQAIRVRLEEGEDGPVAIPNGGQASHMITSLVGADALALIPAGQGVMEAGSAVSLLPFPA
jgi:molybdopterin molybdotransferase